MWLWIPTLAKRCCSPMCETSRGCSETWSAALALPVQPCLQASACLQTPALLPGQDFSTDSGQSQFHHRSAVRSHPWGQDDGNCFVSFIACLLSFLRSGFAPYPVLCLSQVPQHLPISLRLWGRPTAELFLALGTTTLPSACRLYKKRYSEIKGMCAPVAHGGCLGSQGDNTRPG